MSADTHVQPFEVFYSYSHKDEKLRDELARHLSSLERQCLITGWHDRKIGPGTEWKGHIDEHLNTAHVILLLVSSDFLASDYCYDVEMHRAMERHDSGEARVIPIMLRPCDWKLSPFAKLQALPKDGRPVTKWRSHDEAFTSVAEGMRAAVRELLSGNREGAMPHVADQPVSGPDDSSGSTDLPADSGSEYTLAPSWVRWGVVARRALALGTVWNEWGNPFDRRFNPRVYSVLLGIAVLVLTVVMEGRRMHRTFARTGTVLDRRSRFWGLATVVFLAVSLATLGRVVYALLHTGPVVVIPKASEQPRHPLTAKIHRPDGQPDGPGWEFWADVSGNSLGGKSLPARLTFCILFTDDTDADTYEMKADIFDDAKNDWVKKVWRQVPEQDEGVGVKLTILSVPPNGHYSVQGTIRPRTGHGELEKHKNLEHARNLIEIVAQPHRE